MLYVLFWFGASSSGEEMRNYTVHALRHHVREIGISEQMCGLKRRVFMNVSIAVESAMLENLDTLFGGWR